MRRRHPGPEETEEEQIEEEEEIKEVAALAQVQEFEGSEKMPISRDGAEVSESDAYRMCILTGWISTKEGLN